MPIDLRPQLDLFTQAFVTVLVVMDPVGNVPVFLALTRGQGEAERRRSAWQASAVAGGVILVFAVFGQQLLGLLGISLEALQVAGGLLLLVVALELLQGGAAGTAGGGAGPVRGGTGPVGGEPARNVALVPLGTPLLAGPGAIAATMVYVEDAGSLGGALSVVAALLAAVGVIWLVLRHAGAFGRVLGDNGIDLVSRVVGLLVAAIGIQLVATAVEEWVRGGVG